MTPVIKWSGQLFLLLGLCLDPGTVVASGSDVATVFYKVPAEVSTPLLIADPGDAAGPVGLTDDETARVYARSFILSLLLTSLGIIILVSVLNLKWNQSLRFRARKHSLELEDSEQRLKKFFQATSEGIIFHEGGIIVDVNHGLEVLSGYRASEIIGRNVLDFIAPESKTIVAERMRSGKDSEYEIYGLRKNGEMVQASICANTILHHDRELRVISVNDITERKKMEQQLKDAKSALESRLEKRYQALQLSQNKLDRLLRFSPVVAYTSECSGDFACTYISENVNELFGYSPSDFLAQPGFWANNIHPDDRHRVVDELDKLRVHGRHCQQYRFGKPGGSYTLVHEELRLVYDNVGKPLEIIRYWADMGSRQVGNDSLIS